MVQGPETCLTSQGLLSDELDLVKPKGEKEKNYD